VADRPTLATRIAHLTPVQREQAGATLVLCELIDELIEATNRQSTLLDARLAQPAENRDGQTRGGRKPAAAGPSGTPEGDDKGGAKVQLREPAVPPVDPDGEPAKPGDDRALAEPSTTPATAGGESTTTATTAKKATAAKAATPVRERRR
jgi:hypothetical protein